MQPWWRQSIHFLLVVLPVGSSTLLPLRYEEGAGWAEFLLVVLGRSPFPCPFPASRGCPHSLSHGPFSHMQSQQHPSFLIAFVGIPLSLTFLFCVPATIEASGDNLGPTWISLADFPLQGQGSATFTSSEALTPLIHVTYISQVPGIRPRASLGGHHSACQM